MEKTRRGYHREDDGTLTIVDLLVLDGQLCDSYGAPLERTDETTPLQGWPDDGPAQVWLNGGGREILVPEVT